MNETAAQAREGKIPWPKAPVGSRAFIVTIFPDTKGTDQRPPPRRERLHGLSDEELAWFVETVNIERQRRKTRATAANG